jgi:hypothetical protein
MCLSPILLHLLSILLTKRSLPSSLAFQIGDASGDDVFIDQPAPEPRYGESTPKEYGSGAEDMFIESGKQTTQRDTNWALVPREPLQTDAQNIYPSSACVFVAK